MTECRHQHFFILRAETHLPSAIYILDLPPRSPQSAISRRSSMVVCPEAAKSVILDPRRSSFLDPQCSIREEPDPDQRLVSGIVHHVATMYLLEIQLAQVLAFSLLPACMNRSSFKQTRRLGPPLPDLAPHLSE